MADYDMTLEDLKNRSETDLETRYSAEYLQTQIDDAVALIHATCPTVPDRLRSGTLLANVYKRRIAEIVLRVTRNPGGYQSESEGGASYSRFAIVASGNLWLTNDDIAILNGVTASGTRVPGTMSIGVDSGWVS